MDNVQIKQVLVNLIRNGMEAMASVSGEKVLDLRVCQIESAVQIEIRDRGHGIESPDRIFEPFFTTKEHGMGMGLAICRSIVESHGGRLWAEKNEPQGAALIFTLPIESKVSSCVWMTRLCLLSMTTRSEEHTYEIQTLMII